MSPFILISAMVFVGDCSAEPLPIPTRAEVIAFDLDTHARKDQRPCVPFSLEKGERCAQTRSPVAITGKALTDLTSVLRDRASYDLTRAAACHEPRHQVRFYYGTSRLDVWDICFACNNVSVGGSNPFVGCEPDGKSSMPSVMNLSAAAFEKIRATLERAKVDLVPKRAAAE